MKTSHIKTILQYSVIILLSLLGGFIIIFLLPYSADGDEGNATVKPT